jgi:hypothetical protein
MRPKGINLTFYIFVAYVLVNFPTNRFELEVERRATFPAHALVGHPHQFI